MPKINRVIVRVIAYIFAGYLLLGLIGHFLLKHS